MSEITTLLTKLGDHSRPLVHRDLRGLSDLGADQEPEILAAWQTIRVERRRAIIRAMTELAEDNVEFDFRDVLCAALNDDDAVVREAAAAGLWEDDRIRTLRRLLPLLNHDPVDDVRAAVALALGHFAYQAELGELRADDAAELRQALLQSASTTNPEPSVRRRALESVGYFSGSDITELIAQAYATGETIFKESALVAIGHNLDERWLPVLKAELQSKTPSVRYEAARATGEFGEAAQTLLASLLPLLEEDDAEVAGAAVWALGQLGGSAARRVLERLTQSDNDVLQQLADDALTELRFNEEGGMI